MKDIHVMKHRETFQSLESHLPDGTFIDIFPGCLVLFNQLEHITSFKVFCHDTEGVGEFIVEGILVTEDTGMVDACQNSNFIEAVGQFFFIESRDADLLHGILEPILFALDLVDYRESSFSQFGNHGVLVH